MMKTMTRDIRLVIDFAFRFLVLLGCLAVGLLMVIGGARAAMAATLKPDVVLTGTVLTLGDLFDGLSEEKARTVLGPAPRPGADMVLNAHTLMRIAASLDLPWRPAAVTDQVRVSTAATIIDAATVEALVKDALVSKGLTGSFSLLFAGAVPEIVLPQDQPAQAEIANIRYNPGKDVFEATLSAPSIANPVQKISLSGQIEHKALIPVLRSTLRNGDIIGPTDFETIEVSVRDLQKDYILDPAELTGMTPRRLASAGKPLRLMDFENPQMVGRGEVVTLIYSQGPLTLTAKGKALQNGARGDIIRVVNVNSSRALEGLVTDTREITIAQQ